MSLSAAMHTGFFEVELPCRQIVCICGHPITAYDFRIDDFEDARELRASCSDCRRILLRITWNKTAQDGSDNELALGVTA